MTTFRHLLLILPIFLYVTDFLPPSNNGELFYGKPNEGNWNGFNWNLSWTPPPFSHIWLRHSKSTLTTITVNYPHQVQEISTIPSSSLPYAAAALEQWMAIDQCRRDLRGSHSNSKTGTKTTSSPDPFCWTIVLQFSVFVNLSAKKSFGNSSVFIKRKMVGSLE